MRKITRDTFPEILRELLARCREAGEEGVAVASLDTAAAYAAGTSFVLGLTGLRNDGAASHVTIRPRGREVLLKLEAGESLRTALARTARGARE